MFVKGLAHHFYGVSGVFSYACPHLAHLREQVRSYDCPRGQVMSYEMLRIVMIGFAKL